MVTELAQCCSGEERKTDEGGLAGSLEKELKSRLIKMETAGLQQAIVIQAKEAGNMKMLATVRALASEFAEIVAEKCDDGSPATRSQGASVPSTGAGQLREVALQVGRASKALEEAFLVLDGQISNKAQILKV